MEVNSAIALRSVYEQMRAKNPRLTLRSLARRSGISPATLSQVMSGQRKLTKATALKLCKNLNLSGPERQKLIVSSHASINDKSHLKTKIIDLDKFCFIADWYHCAILSLLSMDEYQSDPAWFAERLGLPIATIVDSLNRLKRLGLILDRDGELHLCHRSIHTTNGVPNVALRSYHDQNLERAREALYDFPVEWREFTGMALSINSERMAEAKQLIRKFRRDFEAFCSDGPQDMAYNFSLQFYPIESAKVFLSRVEQGNDS